MPLEAPVLQGQLELMVQTVQLEAPVQRVSQVNLEQTVLPVLPEQMA